MTSCTLRQRYIYENENKTWNPTWQSISVIDLIYVLKFQESSSGHASSKISYFTMLWDVKHFSKNYLRSIISTTRDPCQFILVVFTPSASVDVNRALNLLSTYSKVLVFLAIFWFGFEWNRFIKQKFGLVLVTKHWKVFKPSELIA